MSSKGKGAPRNPLRKTGKSRSAKAGLTFPVSRILSKLRNGEYSSRVGQSAPVFLAAVLEYLTAEILELSGNAARDNHKMRVNPRHIQLAIRNDDELNRLLDNVIVPEGGVNPHIHLSLMPKGSGSSSSSKDKTEKSPTSPKKAPQKRKAAGSTASSSSSSAAPEKGEPKAKKAKKSKSSSSSSSADPSGPMWQYSDNGWKNYDKEANDVVEQAYQDYLNNPGLCDVRAVKSGQWHYQVDFLNWKQTNVDHNNHTSRSIRRVTPSAVAEAPPS